MTLAVLIIAILIVLFYGQWIRYTAIHGAPFVPLDPDVVYRVIKMTDLGKDDTFYDLGSGDGRLVIAAAMKGATAIGVEKDWIRVWYSRLWIKLLRLQKQARIIHGDIFNEDYSHATIVHTYLLQETNDKLQEKLAKELKKGTKVLSSAFVYTDWKLLQIEPRGTPYGPLYLYTV